MTRVLITGAAGFIGYHLASNLYSVGHDVVGLDNFNSYYDPQLKKRRENILAAKNIKIHFCDLADPANCQSVISEITPEVIIHLAAYAGVRHSYDHAMEYIKNNILATQNLIDTVTSLGIRKVIYASTSCVMAGNPLPWKEDSPTGHQLNPYGYTKRTNECQFITSPISQTIGLRFFTVYGPYGRPDMALFGFSEAAVSGKTIDVFNYGNMKRDFTYVTDIVEGILLILEKKLIDDNTPLDEIYNIGRGEQVHLMDFIAEIEKNFGLEIKKNMVGPHPADTLETWSDTTKLQALGWKPRVSIPEGVEKFVNWYKSYYGATR